MRGGHKGLFITFEKTAEGLGGTTQTLHLYENLKRAGMEVALTRQPGGTGLGDKIREILLNPAHDLSKATELFLFMADRAQHYKEIVKPALRAGKVVVCDRYFDTTLVYQGSARGWKSAFLWRLHNAATGSLLPDLTIVLDGTPHCSRSENDRIEKLGDDFHLKVKRGMLHLASKADRYVLVNANQDETAIANQIVGIVRERFPERFKASELALHGINPT